MLIKTNDITTLRPFIDRLYIPPKNSHKGQNGRVLIIGGSSLFHSASIWAAETASYFCDIVHYSSTKENEKVFLSLKKKFHNGIVVPRKDLLSYVQEDDAILIGPGMVRGKKNSEFGIQSLEFEDVLKIEDEADFTYALTGYLIHNFPDKKFVFDAGSLQMMEGEWLLKLKEKPIVTPHHKEFEMIFKEKIIDLSPNEKIKKVREIASKHNCMILLKAVSDIISDGKDAYLIEGGNAGLTKGGTGDVLAGLSVGFFAKNDAITSSVMASYLIKKTGEDLYSKKGYWYNIKDIIEDLSYVLNKITTS